MLFRSPFLQFKPPFQVEGYARAPGWRPPFALTGLHGGQILKQSPGAALQLKKPGDVGAESLVPPQKFALMGAQVGELVVQEAPMGVSWAHTNLLPGGEPQRSCM